MGRALIIGCGGVAGVVIHKCCQNSDVFEEIMIASRTKSKCDAIKEKLDGTTATKIRTAKVDADNVDEPVSYTHLRRCQPGIKGAFHSCNLPLLKCTRRRLGCRYR